MSRKQNTGIERRLETRYLTSSEDWQLVHGNLMTILMIFFLTMFSYYHIEKKGSYENVIAKIQEDFGGIIDKSILDKIKYKEKEEEVAKEFSSIEGLKKFTKIEVDREKIRIIFPDPVIFATGSADLKPQTVWIISEIAERMKKLPDNRIVIEGHTDNIPMNPGSRYSSNWELSLRRSLSIVHYLVDVEGLDPTRFIPIGYGEHRPLFPNDTAEDRAQNRRIEINIIKKG